MAGTPRPRPHALSDLRFTLLTLRIALHLCPTQSHSQLHTGLPFPNLLRLVEVIIVYFITPAGRQAAGSLLRDAAASLQR